MATRRQASVSGGTWGRRALVATAEVPQMALAPMSASTACVRVDRRAKLIDGAIVLISEVNGDIEVTARLLALGSSTG
jgi:hypothetical protein